MKALIVIVMALVPSLFQPVPTLAHDAGARTRQTIPVNERLEDTFQLAGDGWLQLRVTPEDGGTRVEGLTDWHR